MCRSKRAVYLTLLLLPLMLSPVLLVSTALAEAAAMAGTADAIIGAIASERTATASAWSTIVALANAFFYSTIFLFLAGGVLFNTKIREIIPEGTARSLFDAVTSAVKKHLVDAISLLISGYIISYLYFVFR